MNILGHASHELTAPSVFNRCVPPWIWIVDPGQRVHCP